MLHSLRLICQEILTETQDVDLLDLRQLAENRDLLDEILKDKVRVYEQSEK